MCDRPPAGERPAALRNLDGLPTGRLQEESASNRHATVRWQHGRAPCSAWIPLSPVAEGRLPGLASNHDGPRPDAARSTDAVESRPR